MSKVKTLKLIEEECYGTPCYQEIVDAETNDSLFSASDLSETPEDCTLTRDLFNAYDFISAVEYGMQLSQEGYDYIELERCEEHED